jgi:undecaprenyl-diphosphatase
MHQYLSKLDFQIFSGLNSLTRFSGMDWLFVLMAVYLAYVMAGVIAGYWFTRGNRAVNRKAIILSGIAFILARLVFANIIREIWVRNRPFIAHDTVHKIIAKNDNEASFPSGHASAMFAISMVVYSYNKKLGIILMVMSTLTAFARVVVGVHYPSDVIGGALLGLGTGYLVVKLLDKKIEPVSSFFSRLSDRILPFTKTK